MKEEKENLKCSETKLCKPLLQRCQKSKQGGVKGFVKLEFTDLNTGEDTGEIIVYSTGRSDKGLLLNFCPFCGFPHYEKYKEWNRIPNSGKDIKNVDNDSK